MRPFRGWLVTGALAIAVGAGQVAAQAGTCYDATLGPWTPIEGSARTQEARRPPPDESSDSLSYLFPPRILLSERPVERGTEERFVIVVPEDALTVPKSSLAWRIDGDSLGVWVMDWTSGVRGWASRTDGGWSGTLESWSHQLGLQRYSRAIRLDAVDCATPPPVPSVADRPAPRAIPSVSGPSLRLGEPVPEGYELRPVRLFEMVLDLEPAGYWAGADSVFVIRNARGLVEQIEVRYPPGFEGLELRDGLLDEFGPGEADRFWASWENRTTRAALQLARSEGRTRVILIDPRMEH
jgi:hypothetical protein